MAVFTINETTFNVTNGNNANAFEGDSAGADTLTVTIDGFLIALGNNSNGARLANTGAWKVTVNGLIYSQEDDGIRLLAGNAAQSTITIGADGEVSGNGSNKGAINIESAAKVTNAGVVSGETFGILAQVPTTITNTGTISGTAGGSFGILAGAGTAGVYTVTNSGVILGGTAAYSDFFGVSDDKITNSGTMTGGLQLGNGNNSVTNSGTIDDIVAGSGNDAIVNSKTITGDVLLGGGTDTVKNTGTVGGIVDLGAGNDVFTGGNFAETVRDADGSDTYKFGSGNDTYLAKRLAGGDGTDSVDGGTGIDTYDASGAAASLIINLDTVTHDLAAFGLPGAATQLKNTATGADVAGGAGTKDTVTNFENAKGGSGGGGDTIYGSSGANVLEGNGGNDSMLGFGGNDTLLGGAGFDFIAGGAGRDTLDGGIDGNQDRLIFTSTSDSTVGKAGRDRVVNFEDGFDVVDLTLIDAVAGGANDAFTLVNADSSVNPAGLFSGVAGQLRTQATATGWMIQGDVNGDQKADFAIDIVDPTHSVVLTAADFLL